MVGHELFHALAVVAVPPHQLLVTRLYGSLPVAQLVQVMAQDALVAAQVLRELLLRQPARVDLPLDLGDLAEAPVVLVRPRGAGRDVAVMLPLAPPRAVRAGLRRGARHGVCECSKMKERI